MSADRSRQVFAHLAIALSAHVKSAGRSGLVVRVEVLTLRDLAQNLATARQDATPLAVPSEPGEADVMAPRDALLLTKRDAAAALRVSTRTVERLIAAGTLRAVTVGSSPRIRRADLEAYVESLTPAPSSFREAMTTKELTA